MLIIAGGIILAIFLLCLGGLIARIGFFWIVAAATVLCGGAAAYLGQDNAIMYFAGAFVSACIAYSLDEKKKAMAVAHTAAVAAQFKACPRCAETVKAQATVCKHCGHEFEGVAR
jgi:ribosomal protein L32